MKTIKRTIVSAVLVSSDNKLLLGKNRDGGVYPDCWHIPGGGVEEGESKDQALAREIREEVGIDIRDLTAKLIRDSDTGTAIKTDKVTGEKCEVEMRFHVYEVLLGQLTKDIKVSLDDDLVEYEWVSKTDLAKYKHTPPSEKLFRSLGWIGDTSQQAWYVTHSFGFDYQNELYVPLKKSVLSNKFKLILPHDKQTEPRNSEDWIREADLILAEVSHPSTGQGIELGWAHKLAKRIVCVYKQGTKPSSSLKFVSQEMIEYKDSEDLIRKLASL